MDKLSAEERTKLAKKAAAARWEAAREAKRKAAKKRETAARGPRVFDQPNRDR